MGRSDFWAPRDRVLSTPQSRIPTYLIFSHNFVHRLPSKPKMKMHQLKNAATHELHDFTFTFGRISCAMIDR